MEVEKVSLRRRKMKMREKRERQEVRRTVGSPERKRSWEVRTKRICEHSFRASEHKADESREEVGK
jgi:hypothetical protein